MEAGRRTSAGFLFPVVAGMPDPLRQTVSASQAAGLFNASPYVTRRALYDFFHDNVDLDERENESMSFGKAIESFILRRTADKLALEVVHNFAAEYVRREDAPIGCTLDARVTCPTRGPGIVQAKSVRWQVHKADWTPAKAPLHIEIQTQHEMLVTNAKWGVIACMIGANEDFLLYERRPDERVYERLLEESRRLMADVANHNRPPVFGEKIELRGIEQTYPEADPEKRLEDMSDADFGQLLRDLDHASKQAAFFSREADHLKVKILDRTQDHGRVRVYSAEAKINKVPVAESAITLPWPIRSGLMKIEERSAYFAEAGVDITAIREAIAWRQVTRKGGIQNRITITPHDEDGPLPENAGGFIIEGG